MERGYFQEYGLDVDLLYTRTVSGIQAMLAGEVQFMATGCTEVMESRRAGHKSSRGRGAS